MHLYLNYAREHWTQPGENPPVGLILCAEKNDAVARYALEGLPNKVLAARVPPALPDEKRLAAEIEQTRERLEARRVGTYHGAGAGDPMKDRLAQGAAGRGTRQIDPADGHCRAGPGHTARLGFGGMGRGSCQGRADRRSDVAAESRLSVKPGDFV